MKALLNITHIIVDVDGTLTDGGIYYDDNGTELKKFNTRDGAGFFAAHKAGFTVIVLTGRNSPAVERRMCEMHVDVLEQNIVDKAAWLGAWQRKQGLGAKQFAYLGDELNDLAAMRLCGFRACPADACPEVRAEAHYISPVCGGSGVLRDVIFHILNARGQWLSTIRQVYGF